MKKKIITKNVDLILGRTNLIIPKLWNKQKSDFGMIKVMKEYK